MSSLTAKMHWNGGVKFEGTSAFGHKIVTDTTRQSGGEESGYKPSELVLFGLAGCTGIDVVRILEKMQQKVHSLEIEVTGHQNDDYPKPFHTVEVKYIFTGEDLDPERIGRAIELSEGKYCLVSQTIQQPGKIITSFEIKPA
jgi:putative redox protein